MSKERLVELLNKFKYDCLLSCKDGFITVRKDCDVCVMEQLADYLLARGVIVPTSKVGEKIYIHQFNSKMEKVVVECEIIEQNEAEEFFKVKLADGRRLTLLFQFIGKTVFLTKEEAEAKLKESEGK